MGLIIKGHPTRGKEVIELLEMIGGKNYFHYDGSNQNIHYTVTKDNRIDWISNLDSKKTFTLENFIEKFPYKKEEKVLSKVLDEVATVVDMKWNDDINTISYKIKIDKTGYETIHMTEQLQKYENENIENNVETVVQNNYKKISLADCDSEEVEIELADKFEIKTKNGKTYAVRKNKYPKNYSECCQTLNVPLMSIGVVGYKSEVLNYMQMLILCRDAYWEIAGRELGLNQMWKPNFKDGKLKYTIECHANQMVDCANDMTQNIVLTFPTIEMRDEFYKHFEDIIERVKEFL